MNYFLSFGSENKYADAAKRLEKQVTRTNIFDTILVYNSDDLRELDEFWNLHSEFIKNNPKKYGYGIWKPYIVMKSLLLMNYGDILMYTDASCDFDIDCENVKEAFKEIVCKDDFEMCSSLAENSEHLVSKLDLVYSMNMIEHADYKKPQIESKAFIMKKSDVMMKFVKAWYALSCKHELLTNKNFNFSFQDFIEHKCEQSIFSLLLKKMGLYSSIHFDVESLICFTRNNSGVFYLAPRITRSNIYSNFGEEFIGRYQVIHMSSLVRKYNPQYIFESGFGSGSTMAIAILSCRKCPILHYVNCDKNYHLYEPISTHMKKVMTERFSFIQWYEMRTSELIKEDVLKNEFPHGIDWATIDGDPTFEGCLVELIGIYSYMKKGGVIYIIADRLKRKNRNIMLAVDLFIKLFSINFFVDDVMCTEILYMIV